MSSQREVVRRAKASRLTCLRRCDERIACEVMRTDGTICIFQRGVGWVKMGMLRDGTIVRTSIDEKDVSEDR